MKKKIVINLTSINSVDDERSKIELTTAGTLESTEDGYEIRYEESEVTGFEGSTTCLAISKGNIVNLKRTGASSSHLVLEKGKKHHCHYGTPYGDFTMGIFTHCIDADINENGGEIYLKYTVDINSSYVSDNEIYIKVTE